MLYAVFAAVRLSGSAYSAVSLGEMRSGLGRGFGVSSNLVAKRAVVMKSREAVDRARAVGGWLTGSHQKTDVKGAFGGLWGRCGA